MLIPNLLGNGDVAQQEKVLATKPEDLSSVPGVHMVGGET